MTGKIPIRIWSAASSTGQEAYSTAITIKELIPNLEDYNITILATDISEAAVAQASRGHYGKFEIDRGLNPELLNKYFTEHNETWKINDDIRSMVKFQRLSVRILMFRQPMKRF